MASRLVEILSAGSRADDLHRVLGELESDVLTEEVLADGRVRLRVLVEADQSGGVVDRVQREFGSTEQFRLLILPVEAALPRQETSDRPSNGGPRIGMRGVSRAELYADVEDMSRLSRVFYATVVLSSVVAAVGMLRDNVAVIIGAMVIAPLLGPNVALALGTTLGDGPLIRRSLRSNLIGLALALVLAVILGIVLTIDPAIRSIEERTVVHISDIVLALASGSASTLALTSGIPTALVGVMVAVALLPPTMALGLTVGDAHWDEAAGAALLLLANVICVNLAGVLTFLAQGVRPLSWWEAARARRATWLAIVIWITLLVVLIVVIVAAENRMDEVDRTSMSRLGFSSLPGPGLQSPAA